MLRYRVFLKDVNIFYRQKRRLYEIFCGRESQNKLKNSQNQKKYKLEKDNLEKLNRNIKIKQLFKDKSKLYKICYKHQETNIKIY